MSAAKALKAARAAGVNLGIDGDDLVLEAAAPPPPAVIDLLSRHKAEVSRFKRSAARPRSVSEVRRKKHEALKASLRQRPLRFPVLQK
jgi:hypothetical protein